MKHALFFVMLTMIATWVMADDIGTWEYSNQSYSATVTITTNASGQHVVKTTFLDGSINEAVLDIKIVGNETRYVEQGNNFGEYYVINEATGNLDLYDEEGYLFTGILRK